MPAIDYGNPLFFYGISNYLRALSLAPDREWIVFGHGREFVLVPTPGFIECICNYLSYSCYPMSAFTKEKNTAGFSVIDIDIGIDI